MLERTYQAQLIKRIHHILPGSMVLKNDANYIQGFPDLLVLYRHKWAALEVKPSLDSDYQPNQKYYLEKLGSMSFAACISPENEEEVLDALQHSLRSRRTPRFSVA